MTTYIYTSIALNYLPKARVLSTTLKKYHPEYKMCVVLVEKITQDIKNRILQYNDIDMVLRIDDLPITDGFNQKLPEQQLTQWYFTHSIVELCTAIKGSALCYLLNQPDCKQVFYFDPDIAIFDSLHQLTSWFSQSYSILLTPHATNIEYIKEDVWRNEIGNLKRGVYNLGFIGVKNDTTGHKFANWWKSRLDMYCYDDVPNGVFTDQSWCDMVPAVFDNVKILREPQYNVSTWNLTHRFVDGEDINNLYVNKQYKLCFYHFSGFDSGAQIGMLLKYARKMPKLFLLRKWYKTECNKLEETFFSNMRWSFGYYMNGVPIESKDRKHYRQTLQLQQEFPNPFTSNNGIFLPEFITKHNLANSKSVVKGNKLRIWCKAKILKLLHNLL